MHKHQILLKFGLKILWEKGWGGLINICLGTERPEPPLLYVDMFLTMEYQVNVPPSSILDSEFQIEPCFINIDTKNERKLYFSLK